MKKLILAILLVMFSSFTLFAQSKITKEEYAIYAFVLNEIFKENLKNNNERYSFVILDKTHQPEFVGDFVRNTSKSLAQDFLMKNESAIILENSFPTKHEYRLVGETEIENLLKIGADEVEQTKEREKNQLNKTGDFTSIFWSPFYEKFPGVDGYYSFTRIGFSGKRNFAIVEVKGKGTYWTSNVTYILKKVKNRWSIYIVAGGHTVA